MKICKQCGGIAEWNSYYGGITCTRCYHVEKPKPTNADRIRAMRDMSDEELAGLLWHYLSTSQFINSFASKAEFLDWLKAPVDKEG